MSAMGDALECRVLVINTIGLYFEGITSVIYNYMNAMDRSNMAIDFIGYESIDKRIEEKFKQLGRVLFVPERKKNVCGYIRALDKILENKYDVVHIHGNSGTMCIESILAKKNKVPKIIVHCHNTTCNHPGINKVLTPIMKISANTYIGCSKAAGDWLFGNSYYFVLNNAISIDQFKYDEKIREDCRKDLGISNELVLGHVGHFTEQKNHTFLIDVFAETHKRIPNSKLLLISDGPKMQSIKDKVEMMGLSNWVIYTGARSDVDRLYQAMDFFLMPSRWEGLPVVMLEAQAAALPMLVSSVITSEAKCIDGLFYKSLDDGANSWANEIDRIINQGYVRDNSVLKGLQSNGFDIEIEADKLKQIYMSIKK